MNIVIFSYHFLPKAGAESYCTTRFASALASAGHHVHVVTMDWPKGVSDEVFDFLVDKRIEITRVPLLVANRPPIFSRIKYLTHEWDSINFSRAISTLKQVLLNEDNPILLSRSFPWASLIVGWHCRKYASKWIAHLSDPLPAPWEPPNSLTFKLRYIFGRIWVKRIFRDAQLFTLTCEEAKLFFRKEYGEAFDRMPTCVVNHIGEPPLPVDCKKTMRISEWPYIVHTGDLYGGRGAKEIQEAMRKLNESGVHCGFIQCGHTNVGLMDGFSDGKYFKVLQGATPDVTAAVANEAAAVFIPDVNTPLDYVPFLPSKFAYQIFSDKPLILFSKRESELHRLYELYPNSGLYFADRDEPDSLIDAINQALVNKVPFDRTEIRKRFSRQGVIDSFVKAVESLG